MSRCGRAIELLNDWKDHDPDACDGVMCDRSHLTDPWDVAGVLDTIDPFGRQDEIDRLRALISRILDYSAFTHSQIEEYRKEAGITP